MGIALRRIIIQIFSQVPNFSNKGSVCGEDFYRKLQYQIAHLSNIL